MKSCRLYGDGLNQVHPGRLTWNLRIHPWRRKKNSSNSPCSGSMLIFGGVPEVSFNMM